MSETIKRWGMPPGFLGGIVFFAVVAAGCAYIVLSKIHGLPALYVTMVPVLIMIGYALLLGLARLFRLRDDQSGDNLYYMGFLFTLTSLAVSLYQFSNAGSAEQIVQNFGIAIASTIAGIALRIFFNQMRRDPVEVEHTARLELAEASRKVKRELETTVIEFSYFRRATQQSITDVLEEIDLLLKEAKDRFIGQLDEFAVTSSKPLEEASKRSGETIESANLRIAKVLEAVSKQIASESAHLSSSTVAITKSIDDVVSKLKSLQTPEQIIEVKLNPTIQGLSRAVNKFATNAETQGKAVDQNLKQTQAISHQIGELLAYLRERERIQAAEARQVDPYGSSPQGVAGGFGRPDQD
jgi:hypothetical protein